MLLLIALLLFQDAGTSPADAWEPRPDQLPAGMTPEGFSAGMAEAIRVGRNQDQPNAGEKAICDDLGAAIGDLLQERSTLQASRIDLDNAYFEQANANASAAVNGATPSEWQSLAMELMRLKRSEMTGRLEDQNVALYAMSRAGLAFCPSRP